MEIILASQSKSRYAVLTQAGLNPLVHPADINENKLLATETKALANRDKILFLAQAKAKHVVQKLQSTAPELLTDSIILAGDSMLEFESKLYGKPKNSAAAIELWKKLTGKTGRLLTGHHIIQVRNNKITATASQLSCSSVQFNSISISEIENYVATGEPTQVAGGFTIDGIGAWFIKEIHGNPSGVLGLSLPTIKEMLMDLKINLIDIGVFEENKAISEAK